MRLYIVPPVRPQPRTYRLRALDGLGACVNGYDADTNEVCYDSSSGGGGYNGGGGGGYNAYDPAWGISPEEYAAITNPGGTMQPGVNPNTSAGSSLSYAQVLSLLSGAAKNAAQTMHELGTPGLVPGTQLVYNPATGQFLPASGALYTAGGLANSLTTPLIIGGCVVAGLLLMSMMKK